MISGMGSFWSRRVPLGPVVATLWSVMVPSCLRSVLSGRKLALAGLGWSTCVSELGPFSSVLRGDRLARNWFFQA